MYYFLTNPLINTVVTKMAEYPITQISYDTPQEDLKKRWQFILEDTLDFLAFAVGVGLDYFTYGNCFVSISFPFTKYLKCPNCEKVKAISDVEYKFRDYQYLIVCAECGYIGPSKVLDRHKRSLKGVRLIRWAPQNMGLHHNTITGDTIYVYDMPQTLKNDILIGKPEIIEKVPHEFIEALRLSKAIQFSRDNLFHLKRPNLAEQDMGWGLPLPLPVLKDVFYLQVLKKAQEAIAEQRIVPLEVLFPQPSSSTGDPYGLVDLSNWTSKVEEEIARWRFDPNHIPIMPLPIGHQLIGGDGRALLLHQEIRLWSEQIVIGMGVPIEFVFGGASWSGSNVSLRMIENMFLKYRRQLLRLLVWIRDKISLFMGIPTVPMHFTDFKMADDMQKKQLLVNLATMNKVSDRTLLDEFNLDYVAERKQIEGQFRYDAEYQKRLMVAQAEAQGEAGLVSAKYQSKMATEAQGQMVSGAEGENAQGGGGMDVRSMAEQYARRISGMQPAEKTRVLTELQQRMPQMAQLVLQLMNDPNAAGGGSAGGAKGGSTAPKQPAALGAGVNMKPLPTSKPPRRSGALI
jgi:hypothetical protein